jgi:hypothetical protein
MLRKPHTLCDRPFSLLTDRLGLPGPRIVLFQKLQSPLAGSTFFPYSEYADILVSFCKPEMSTANITGSSGTSYPCC